MKNYSVYILTNKSNSVLYIGVTNDLTRRMDEHKSCSIEGFTKRYNLKKLVYLENFSNVNDAISAEKKLKGWLRKRKINLINEQNPGWKDLSLSF